MKHSEVEIPGEKPIGELENGNGYSVAAATTAAMARNGSAKGDTANGGAKKLVLFRNAVRFGGFVESSTTNRIFSTGVSLFLAETGPLFQPPNTHYSTIRKQKNNSRKNSFFFRKKKRNLILHPL